MAANVDPIFLLTPQTVGVKITAADTTTKKTAFTASTNGGAVITLTACSFDASPRIVVLSYNDGTTSFQIGEISVPAGSGTDGTNPPVNLLDPLIIKSLDSDGSFVLKSLSKIEVSAKTTVTGNIDIVGIAGDY